MSLVTKKKPDNSPSLKTLTVGGSPSNLPNFVTLGKNSFATSFFTQLGSEAPHLPSLKLLIYLFAINGYTLVC